MADNRVNSFNVIPTLGRKFRIGDFYNCITDQILQENQSAWKTSKMLASTITEVETSFNVTLNTSHSDVNILNQMGLDNQQKMSVMVGLIDSYSGASNYLKNRPNSWQVYSGTLICKVQSRKEFLHGEIVSANLNSVLRGKWKMGEHFPTFTHIVHGFVYGAEAYCILAKDVGTGRENIQESENYLNGLLAKMKDGLEDNQDLSQFIKQFTKREKKKLKALHCRVYSDLETSGKCSILEAYDHFYNLIQEMKITTKENLKAVPISALLFPVTLFPVFKNQQARCKYRCIDAKLIHRCSRVLIELDRVIATTEKFCLPVKEICYCPSMDQFVWSILKFKQLMRTILKKAVVDARHIDGNDGKVKQIVNAAKHHPLFKKSQLERWLLNKKKEMEIRKKVTSLKKIDFLANKEQLMEQLNSSNGTKYKYAFVLFIPPLYEWTNGILEAMKRYVGKNTFLEAYEIVKTSGYDQLPWYNDDQKLKQVLDEIRELEFLVKRSNYGYNRTLYYITFGKIGQPFGFSYSIYQSGKLVAENLNKLPSPPTGLRIYVDESNRKFARVVWNYEDVCYSRCRFVVQQKITTDSMWKQKKATDPNQTESIVELKPNCVNNIRVVTETCIGRSEGSNIVYINSAHLDGEDVTVGRVNTLWTRMPIV